MKYAILHEIPGRMRVHCTNLHLNPESSLHLNRWVGQHEEVLSARLSTKTGNLVIHYSRQLSRETMLIMLDDLQLFGVAKVARDPGTCRILAGMVCKAYARETAIAVVGGMVPRSVRHVMSGWRMASRGSELVRMTWERDFPSLCLAVARSAAFALLGATPLLRFLFILGRSLLALLRRTEVDDQPALFDEQGNPVVTVQATVVDLDESGVNDFAPVLPLLHA